MKTQRENCVKCPHACVISLPTVFEVNLAYFMKLEALLSGFPQAKKGLSPCLRNPWTVVVLCLFKNSSHCSMGLQDAGILIPFFLPRPLLLKHLKHTGRMYYVHEIHTHLQRCNNTQGKSNNPFMSLSPKAQAWVLELSMVPSTDVSNTLPHGSSGVVKISDPEIHLGTHLCLFPRPPTRSGTPGDYCSGVIDLASLVLVLMLHLLHLLGALCYTVPPLSRKCCDSGRNPDRWRDPVTYRHINLLPCLVAHFFLKF